MPLQVAHGNVGSVTDILAGVIHDAANTGGVALPLGRVCWQCKVTCTHLGLLRIANPSNHTYCLYY